ncbi:related to MXR2 - Methionine-R-sulfoxide reductase [Ustilago trichophora]|uniref:Peptide-methionine (R)-S-oxide reductase n=1 Tax=Ustilago trichophora TaxID=86804 RepID=A0A5C3DTY7_9BASI|nr:related to MXR2 - Methionine-R-sulfoxide reductase [Ustilago trichophora]
MALARSGHRSIALLNTITPTRKTLLSTGAVVASVAAFSSGYLNPTTALRTVSSAPAIFNTSSLFSPRFFSSSPAPSFKMGSTASSQAAPESFPKGMSNAEWRTKLNAEQFRILREKGTEMAGTGKYNKHYPKDGVYTCAGCDSPLYKATTKFDSGCGWPAFFDAIPGAIDRHSDRSWGMERIEITCKNCGGHLGHVFKGEGFNTPTNERHCVNSVSINFDKDDAKI